MILYDPETFLSIFAEPEPWQVSPVSGDAAFSVRVCFDEGNQLGRAPSGFDPEFASGVGHWGELRVAKAEYPEPKNGDTLAAPGEETWRVKQVASEYSFWLLLIVTDKRGRMH